MANTIAPTIAVAAIKSNESVFVRYLNRITRITSDPLTKFGTVVVTVALKLVPNCSDATVTNIAQKPTEKPNRKITALKNKISTPLRFK